MTARAARADRADRAPDRVVVLTTDFLPQVGGVADHLHRLSESLAGSSAGSLAGSLSERMPVTVMTSVAQGGATWPHAYALDLLPPLVDRRLGQRFGDGIPLLRKLYTGLFFLSLRQYGAAVMKRIAPRPGEDVAILIGIWDTASHFWCAAARRAGLPYYLFAHGVELLIPLYGDLPAWRREDFEQAAGVIANSRATAALAQERLGLGTTPVVVNPSVGPRPPASAIEPRAIELRGRLPIAGGPVLLSVGRLVARKGFDLVLRSVADLRHECPALTYLVAGDGPERPHLEALVRELDLAAHVQFLGAIDETTKWAAYDVCDLFVMPNRVLGGVDFEGFGIVFLEAALSGRPAIGGRTGGAADAIADGTTGLLVDPEEPGALTLAIRRLLADAPLRQRLGSAAAGAARASHSAQAAAKQLRTQLGWS